MTNFQRVGDAEVKRVFHVWYEIGRRKFKCVLCGGVTEFPSNNAKCTKYEQLTDLERSWCPLRKRDDDR